MQPLQPINNTSKTLRDVWRIIDAHYPFDLSEDWDSCGVIVGDWFQPIHKVLIAADLTSAVVDYAARNSFDLVISHHPLWLRRHTPNSASHKLLTAVTANRNSIALLNAHTNADIAKPGVSDAIADMLELKNVEPLSALPSHPHLGIGRVGVLEKPMKLSEFAAAIKDKLHDTNLRYAGDPNQLVNRVGIVGGSGDSYLPTAVAAGCDVFVTSDLRHHPLQEHLEAGGCAVVDINHALAESLWLVTLAQQLKDFEVEISPLDTRGWN